MNTHPVPHSGKSARVAPATRLKAGRPLDAAKHAGILRAATEIFLESGFQSTSMDEVARRAGVSKITVYSHFTSKQALFAAIIDRLAQKLLAAIGRFAVGDVPPEQALRRFGRMYLELALAPSSLALHRTVVAEAARIPKLGRLIYQNGPAQIVSALADYFGRQPAFDIANPRLAAEQFLGMVIGHAQLSLLLKARPPSETRAEIGEMVDLAVRTFLDGALAPRRARRRP